MTAFRCTVARIFLSVSLSLSVIILTQPSARAAPKQYPGMVWIPGGEFAMGSDAEYSLQNERPSHRVKVSGFWMDEHPVTNAQFTEFVRSTGYVTTAERVPDWEELRKQLPEGTDRPPSEMMQPGSLVFTPPLHPVDLRDMSGWWTWTIGANWRHPQGPQSSVEGREQFPVVQVSWDDAQAYAAWAGKRLPTEAEWEYAAWGGKSGTRYSWGDQLRINGKYMANTFTGEFPHRNSAADGYDRSAPARSFPPNGYGLFGMAGNVWQWTADRYRADMHLFAARGEKLPHDCFNPTRDVPHAEERVIKGGSFLCSPSYCESYRPSARRGTPPDTGSEHVGFRCVKEGS